MMHKEQEIAIAISRRLAASSLSHVPPNFIENKHGKILGKLEEIFDFY